jgi:NAD(P)-dependent dehydrogenase (short-subunit alcohol dehydrogenase family)
MKTGVSERPDWPLAVIVGAGGMGSAIARRLGTRNRLLLADIDEERADRVAAALRSEGHDAISLRCDITDPASVDRLAETVAAQGPMRALAHVAALSPSMGDFRALMNVDLVGAARVEQRMRALCRPGTTAIFISSIAAYVVPPDEPLLAMLDDPLAPDFLDRITVAAGDRALSTLAYNLAKVAVNQLVRKRAAAWGRAGGRITSISPGLIATPMGALEFGGPAGDIKRDLMTKIPLQREGTMLEIADAAEFLASDRASYINGIDLPVDGGLIAVLDHPMADRG